MTEADPTLAPTVWMFALHFAVIGYYLGSDFVVNQMTFYLIASKDVSLAVRTRMRRFQLLCDQHPRMGLILFIATGLTLETWQGYTTLTPGFITGLWIVSALWLANIWAGFLLAGSPVSANVLGKRLVQIDLYWRYLVVAVIYAVAIWSLAGEGPLLPGWLAVKYILCATLMAGGVLMRLSSRPLTAAWGDYADGGDKQAFEAVIARVQYRNIYLNWGLWSLFISMALLRLFGPG